VTPEWHTCDSGTLRVIIIIKAAAMADTKKELMRAVCVVCVSVS
jgi:hypothetical protein